MVSCRLFLLQQKVVVAHNITYVSIGIQFTNMAKSTELEPQSPRYVCWRVVPHRPAVSFQSSILSTARGKEINSISPISCPSYKHSSLSRDVPKATLDAMIQKIKSLSLN